MSQPGTLPIPTPAVPTGQQTARLAALNADGEHAIETLPIESVAAEVGVEKVAATRPTGPELPGVDSKPCSYLSLFRYADKLDIWCVIVGSIGAACSGAALPVFAFLFGKIVNNIGGLTGANLISNVNQTVLYFVYLAIATFVASYLEMALWMLSGLRQTVRIRQRYLTSALQQEISFFDTQATTGDLLQGLNELSNTIQSGIGEKAGNTIHHLATFAAGFAIAFSQGWDMTLVLLAVTPLLAVVGTAVAVVLGRMDTTANTAYARANGIVQESLANVRTVVAFNGQEQTVRRYLDALTMPVRVGVKSGFLNGVTVGATNFAFLGAYALALWYGGLRIRDGAYNGGKVLSVLLSALLGGFALGQAAPNFQYFARARAAGGKCFALIERRPRLQSPDSYVPVDADTNTSSTLELRGVDFAYPTRPDVMVACDLNIMVPAGHTVALVGESGSGKSTAVSLTQRFYDPIRGQVLLDGRDVRGVPVGWLRSQLALVSQEPALFACTIRENIMYGNPAATQEDVERAARDANAHNFIAELPRGYDTLVGEKGAAISGGQKQRIAIARAIVRNPRLLLLDEATAALDARSERIVQGALERLMQGRTTLLVAHRLSTVIGANKIFVMNKGKVIESGRHVDLMSKENGAYATLMRLQQSLPEPDAVEMRNSNLDTDVTLYMGQDPSRVPARHQVHENGEHDSHLDTASTIYMDETLSINTTNVFDTDAGLLGTGAVRPAGMRPHTTPDINDTAADLHDTASVTTDAIRTVHLNDGALTTADVTELRNGDVVLERDDSAERMPTKKKGFFGAGKVKKVSPGEETEKQPKTKKKAKKGKGKKGKGKKGGKPDNDEEEEDEVDSTKAKANDSKADDEPPATASFPRLLGYNKKEWRSAIGGCLASAGLGAVAPVFALAMATIVSVFYTTDYSYMASTIALWAGIYAVIGFASFCLSIFQQGLFTLMGQKLTRRMRKLMFAAALNQEIGWFDREENQSGALASRLAVDTSRIRGAVGDQLGLLFQNLVTLIAAYIIAFIASWKMTLVITATVPIIALAGFFQAKFMLGSNTKAEKVFDQANQMAAEAFINIRIIAAFMLEMRISDLYQQLLAGPSKDSLKQALASGAGYAIGQGVIFLVYAISFWYGGQLVGEGQISFEQMLKVFFAITLAAVGFSQAQIAFPDITKASSAIGKVFTTIDRIPKIRDAPDVKELREVVGHVSLRDVSFSYPQRREVLVLKGFNLEAPAGRTLALVGPSGNGKSTIVSLIERFYDPLSGQVMVDGTSIKSLPLHWWRSNVGLVSQEPVLFGGTIYENLTFGQEDVDPERVAAACEVANAMIFIRSAPDGLDTKIGEGGGIQLSGGQKQRIAIARAVLRDPKVLLLDEATSALDAVSEQVVQQALNRVSKGRTTITIAHRLSTIWDSDSIAVIQSGCVLEQGTHQELSQIPGGAYASLLMSQQAGFALAK